MANETEKTVTISADYFAELYSKAKDCDELKHQIAMKEEQCKECAALCAAKMQCEELEKERDELKAKLDEISKHDAIAISDSRLAAAERCIEEALKIADKQYQNEGIQLDFIVKKLRAWREKREAK